MLLEEEYSRTIWTSTYLANSGSDVKVQIFMLQLKFPGLFGSHPNIQRSFQMQSTVEMGRATNTVGCVIKPFLTAGEEKVAGIFQFIKFMSFLGLCSYFKMHYRLLLARTD